MLAFLHLFSGLALYQVNRGQIGSKGQPAAPKGLLTIVKKNTLIQRMAILMVTLAATIALLDYLFKATLERDRLLQEISLYRSDSILTKGQIAAEKNVELSRHTPEDSTDEDSEFKAIQDLRSRDEKRIRHVLVNKTITPAMLPHILPLFRRHSLLQEALNASKPLVSAASGQLVDALLDRHQHPLIRRRIPLLLGLVLAAAAVVYFDKRQVENLSRKLITSTTATVVEKLVSFFEAADSNLRIAVEQLQMSREPDDGLLKKLLFRLAPFLKQHQSANSIIITELNDNSDYLGILKSDHGDSELQVRIQFAKEWGRGKARMERWKDGKLLESWFRKDDFDPQTRPWHKKSLEVAENEIVATEPYLFYPSNEHGITIATRWRKRDTGRQFITAIDISLLNVTRFTQDMRPSENGVVFVFTNDLRLVGIPADERYGDESAVKAALLRTVTNLNFPILQAGMAEWERPGRIRQAFPFEFDDQSWWAGFEWIEDHPNTVAVFDFGQTPEGTLYYTMEYLNGITLEVLARVSGPQPPARVLYILHQICGSLREAHGRGLIHRDIKPSNIMLCERGGLYDVVKVLDFGLVEESQPEKPELTQPNTIVGTPFYLAPELITDASAFSPLSDLYALSGVAYYLLTGRNVFEGTSSAEICAMHLHDEPVPPSQLTTRKMSSDLEAIVMACLAKEPADRPQGAEVMSEMLAQCQDYGAWTQDQAQKWWANNRNALPMEGHEDNRSPLADTHIFIESGDRTRT